MIPVENKKSEQHHWILHIRISLSIKFHLKLKILIFMDQICPKRVFPVENKQVNCMIEFCILKLG